MVSATSTSLGRIRTIHLYCALSITQSHLLVLDDVVSTGVASGAVAGEHLGSVLEVSGEGSGGDGHHTDNDGGGKLRYNRVH